MQDHDHTASLMTPAKLAQVRQRPAVDRSAWLDRMASDAGHQHISALSALGAEMRARAQRRDFAPLSADLQGVAEALSRLDFGLLEPPGILARLSGKGRNAGVEFAARFERIEVVARNLANTIHTLQGQQGRESNRTELGLLEFDVELRAIEKLIDQGARWLQDMCSQLKARKADAPDEAARATIAADAARCEILVTRLKMLRAASNAAQQFQQQARATAAHRADLMALLAQAIATDMTEWRQRLAPVAAAAREGGAPALPLDAPMESHRELQLCMKQAIADCTRLQVQEQALASALDTLDAQLRPTTTTAH